MPAGKKIGRYLKLTAVAIVHYICMLLGRLPTAQIWSHFDILHCKNKLAGIIKLFPARECLVSGIPAGDRKITNLFLQCAAIVVDASQEHLFAL
jgi:hypothetical protein